MRVHNCRLHSAQKQTIHWKLAGTQVVLHGDASLQCKLLHGVFRNDKLWFDGDTIETDHGNGVVSKMMRMGHIGTFYSRDSIQDPSDSSNVIDFPSTFDPGEKISVEMTKNSGNTTAQISANLRLTGYLYPQELAP